MTATLHGAISETQHAGGSLYFSLLPVFLLSGFHCVVALVHHYCGPPLLPSGLSVWLASGTLSGCPCF